MEAGQLRVAGSFIASALLLFAAGVRCRRTLRKGWSSAPGLLEAGGLPYLKIPKTLDLATDFS